MAPESPFLIKAPRTRSALALAVASVVLPLVLIGAVQSTSFQGMVGDSLPLLVVLGAVVCSGMGLVAAILGLRVLVKRPDRTEKVQGGIAVVVGGVGTLFVVVVGAFIAFFIQGGGVGAPGRPMRVRGRRVLPRTLRGARGVAATTSGPAQPAVAHLSGPERRLLAERWLADARAERASVDAFEHLACDLELAGAPASLVAGARKAAREEIGHTALCLTIASTYADRELALSSRPFAASWRARAESRTLLLRRLALESLFDGCVEEATAAQVARDDLARQSDPGLSHALGIIAREEATHADLAYAVLDWAVREEPQIHQHLEAALPRLAADPREAARTAARHVRSLTPPRRAA